MTTFADISALQPRFSGALLQPGDPGYDTARQVFNGVAQQQLFRLVALKTKYDPGNLFRMNQYIKPATRQ